jgi:hypothetical protein
VRGLAEEGRVSLDRPLQPEDDPYERRLAATVRARHGDELALADAEVDVFEDALSGPVAERDPLELDR